MLYPNPKPSRAPLSVVLSAPIIYKVISISLALSLSFYALTWWSKLEITPADWQKDNVNTTEPEAPVDQDRRFAFIIPSSNPSPNLCKTIFSSLALGYPSPVIINWGVDYRDISHWRLGKHLPKITGLVNYLDSAMHPNATAEEKLEEDDIVLTVDAYDVWFQLPAQVLLSRYHEINRRANKRLHKQWKRKDVPMPMKQTIVAASQKSCYPANSERYGVDLRCDLWPESPLRADLYGPETEKNTTFSRNNRPRWINGGMYIGPAGDMRRMFRRAKQKIEAMVGEGFPLRSDQGMIGELLAAQEVWRELQRHNHVSVDVEDFVGENFEFHVGLDYAQEISAQTFATEISPENDLFDGDFVVLSDQESIDMNSEVRGISPVRVKGIPDDLKSAQSPLVEHSKTVDWSDMPLYTDFFLSTIPAMLHHNKFKEKRETWWDRPWYHQKLRGLVRSALLPREGDEPLATVQLEGSRVRYWAASAEELDRYPRIGKLNANLTVYDRFPSMEINETCRYGSRKPRGSKATWEEEVFRDGCGKFNGLLSLAMRFYASFSLAVGLVAASPCKPPSSTVVSEVLSSSVATGISSTLIESASSTLDSTATTTETDVAETSTAIGSTSTDYTQVSLSTTESLVEPTSTATTSEAATAIDTTTALTTEASSVETSTAVATTTTSEAVPTGYFLVAGEGLALGGKVKSNDDSFTPMLFGDRGSTFNPVRFLVDEMTGELQQDGVTVCAFYQVGLPYALVTRCENHDLYYGSVPLNCAQFEGPGTSIRCSAVKLDCWTTGPGSSQACTRSPDPDWDTFFITTSGDYVWYLSSGTLQNDFMTRVEVFVDHVAVSPPAVET
ncbi:hypothetical protein FACUT_7521 [Fusarium acutatum]|uniref:Uncharacterized protein n=1 Tax=Fusarium acutatum TaxID=78861 RepID=A0A8H4JMJ4_9HYPO|nr:hypothetical protein FACUT_7521 [Fusarium acutatum]